MAIVCTVFILTLLTIVTCVCLKRKSSANITSSAIISPITSTSCNTTKNGNMHNSDLFPSNIITTNDPVYESITNSMPALQRYESNIATTENTAYQCSTDDLIYDTAEVVNDEDIYV